MPTMPPMPTIRRSSLRIAALALASASTLLSASCSGSGEFGQDEQCATALVTGTTFSLPQAAGDRSFQAHATFDGNAIWLTHASAIAADESMRVSALRIQCDGSIASEEVRIADQGGLQTEPRITSYGDKVMLAWQLDDQVSDTNLSTHFKIFDRDDGPANAQAHRLETQYAGTAAGNTWMPELDASAAGFVLAGLRGVSEYESFQAFAQRIDDDGELVGETVNGELTDTMTQNFVSASIDDDGSLVMGWTRASNSEVEHAVHVRVDADSSEPANAPVRVCPGECSMVALGGNEHRGQYVAVATPDGTLGLKPSTLFNAEAPMLSVGTAGASPIYPTVAVGHEGGALAWLQPTSGYNSEIHLQAFRGDGYDMEAVGAEMTVATDNPAIGPNRLSLVHIQDAVYMLTWTEGPTSALQVKWRFVDLAP